MSAPSSPHYLRVLLRNESGLYLQPSGEWTDNRETARTFRDSRVAYFWGLEQKLLHTFVVLAFADPAEDMRIRIVW